VKNDPTTEILEKDQHLIHSFADLDGLKQAGARTVIAEASGAYVYNALGDRYIDGMAGLWCVNVGHGRQEIIEAIKQQLSTLDYFSTFYNLTHPLAAELAHKVTSLAPAHINHVYFSNSGSVANDTAVRILHHYYNRLGQRDKKLILSRIGAYHGSTHLAIAMTTPAYRKGWDSAEELVRFLSSPQPYRRPDNMSEAQFCDSLIEELVRDIEKTGAERIACFIAEPIMGAGGVIVPPQGYHQRAEQVCRDFEIKTISDEVVTAWGRLGYMFASEDVFGLTPDIITTAKGLSSGYQPIAATLLSDEVHDVVSKKGEQFMHGMTYSGHPACCAAALANIEIIESESLLEQVQKNGPLFIEALTSLSSLSIVGDVRGSHFMAGIEFVEDKTSKAPFADDVKIGMRVSLKAQERGLMIRPLGHMIVLSPPLILTPDHIAQIANILRESIEAVQHELGNN
jgi:adenosylmethionine-8-amino-7-oxononanoate aminotransferase